MSPGCLCETLQFAKALISSREIFQSLSKWLATLTAQPSSYIADLSRGKYVDGAEHLTLPAFDKDTA